jgi:precorrin-2/cobalt-factor-2 C20-methyltransferase
MTPSPNQPIVFSQPEKHQLTSNVPRPGKLYGLGVGPGDPELLTLKAHRILTTVPVVAYPTLAATGTSVARQIVAEFIRPDQVELPLPFPFRVEQLAAPNYDQAATRLAEYLRAGQDVAVLCEGEPMLYGTFMYLWQRLAGQFETEVVPGISSTLASAALLGVPLTYQNDVLSILPATLDTASLRDRLAVADAAVIIKLGRHFAKVRTLLAELGLLERALYLEWASLPHQRTRPVVDLDPAEIPYWSLIVIPSARYAC